MRRAPENTGSEGRDSDRIDVEMSDFSPVTSLDIDIFSSDHLMSQDESIGLMVDDRLYPLKDPLLSNFMRWLLRDPFFTRVAQLWVVPARLCVSSDEWEALVKYWCCGRGAKLSKKAATSAKFLYFYTQAKNFFTEVGWPLAIVSLITYDLFQFFQYTVDSPAWNLIEILWGGGNEPFIFSLFSTLSERLNFWNCWLPIILFCAPVSMGYVHAIFRSCCCGDDLSELFYNIEPKQLSREDAEDSSNENSVELQLIDNQAALSEQTQHKTLEWPWDNSPGWLIPYSTARNNLDKMCVAFLFDDTLSDELRSKIFSTIISLAENHKGFARLYAYAALARVAESNLSSQWKQSAREILYKASKFSCCSCSFLLSNYLMWSNGFIFHKAKNAILPRGASVAQRSESQYIHGRRQIAAHVIVVLPFLLRLYAHYRLYRYLIEKVIEWATYEPPRNQCPGNESTLVFNDATGTSFCSACPDWPVYYGQMQTVPDCVEGLLSEPRSGEDINQLFKGLTDKKFELKDINLSQQPVATWTPSQWRDFLNFIKQNSPLIESFNFSMSPFSNKTLNDEHIEELCDFLIFTPVRRLFLDAQALTPSQINNILSSLSAKKIIETLSLRNTTFADDSLNATAVCVNTAPIKALDLSYNQISDAGLPTFTEGISAHHFENIDFSYNAITAASLPEFGQFLQSNFVSKVMLSGNNMAAGDFSVIYSAGNAPNSTTFILVNCQLGDFEVASFSQPLQQNGIDGLDFSDNNAVTDQGVGALLAVAANGTLTELRLRGTQVTALTLDSLASIINSIPLRVLDISNIQVGAADFNRFIIKLVHSTVSTLMANDNLLGQDGLLGLQQLISNRRSTLDDLQLEGNNFPDETMANFILALRNLRLSKLNLARNGVGNKAANALHTILPTITLDELDLSEAGIDFSTLNPWVRVLTASNIKKIYLDRNPLADCGASAIASSLINPSPSPSRLMNAEISNNMMRIISIAKARGSVTTLSLRNVRAGTPTVEAFCHVLYRSKMRIGKLDLSENPDINIKVINPKRCRFVNTAYNQSRFLGAAESFSAPATTYHYPQIGSSSSHQNHSSALLLGVMLPLGGLIIILLLLVRWWNSEPTKKSTPKSELSFKYSSGHPLYSKKSEEKEDLNETRAIEFKH